MDTRHTPNHNPVNRPIVGIRCLSLLIPAVLSLMTILLTCPAAGQVISTIPGWIRTCRRGRQPRRQPHLQAVRENLTRPVIVFLAVAIAMAAVRVGKFRGFRSTVEEMCADGKPFAAVHNCPDGSALAEQIW